MFADPPTARAIAGANKANGSGKIYCYAGDIEYLIAADLATGGWWCLDSTGAARAETGTAPSALPDGNVCP